VRVSQSVLLARPLRAGLAVSSVVLAACGGAKAPPPPPPPTVGVVTVTAQSVPAIFEFTGQAQASKSVEVRSLVSGTIVERYFREGTDVKKGQPLYLIDPAPYEAVYRSTDAALGSSRAVLEQSERDYQRSEALYKGGAISQRDYDVAKTNVEKARAALNEGRASLDRANVDLRRTKIVAEMAGRIGKAELQVGAQVSGAMQLLATIDDLDPIFVDMAVSDNDRLRYDDDVRAGRIGLPKNGQYRVQLVLSDSSTFPVEGRINFGDLRVDEQTGSLRLRAEFPNPGRRLLPGQYVRARLLGATRNDAVLVPQAAVQQALGRQFVYVVVGDTAKTRDIVTGAWSGSDWIVEQGLQPGDQVIVDNIQRVRPGVPVVAKAWSPADSAAPAVRTASAPGGAK
jgi:membrane fusion protein (multidrug efflux system)